MLSCTISDIGIRFGKRLYKYSDIKYFWLYYHPPELRVLNFQIPGKLHGHIDIAFPAELQAAKLRDYLLTQLREVAREETFSEELIRHMGL